MPSPVISSTFDSSDDGWAMTGDVASSGYQATGGNPGGYFAWVDAATGADSYYQAPAAYLGDVVGYYGGTLSYDILDTGGNYTAFDVELIGDGHTLQYTSGQDANFPTPNVWSSASVILTASRFIDTATGTTPSVAEMQDVMSDLTTLEIRAEYVNGAESGGLDNVAMAPASAQGGTVMTTDFWAGNANWTMDPQYWSNGEPTSTSDVVAEPGELNLNTTAAVYSLTNIAGSGLFLRTAALTTGANLTNYGYVYLSNSSITVKGAFVNVGLTDIGDSQTTASITAASLTNTGSIDLEGGAALNSTALTTLKITGAAPTTLTGDFQLIGDVLVSFGSGGVTSIAHGGEIQLYGNLARMAIGGGTADTALKGLAYNAGIFELEGDSSSGAGGPVINTNTGFFNANDLYLDVSSGDGASSMAIGGVLTNFGTVQIGNSNLVASDVFKATGLANSGAINIEGSQNLTSGNQATLNITAPAPSTLTGAIKLYGDALLEFASGAITTIGAGADLQLDGQQSRISIGPGATNSALSGLATNNGTIDLEGDDNGGAGGSAVSTTAAFLNAGNLRLDVAYGDGASSFTTSAALANRGAISIGNSNLSASTTLTASGFSNTGSILIQGNTSGGSAVATLNVMATAPLTLTGSTRIAGNGVLHFQNGGIVGLAVGATLELDDSAASVSSSSGGVNSALTGLTTNSGTLILAGASDGPGGVTVTTTQKLTNYGTIDVDYNSYGDGGSLLGVTGAITNYGVYNIGNTGLSASVNVTANGLTNYGSITIQGYSGGTGNPEAELAINAAAIATATGSTRISGNGVLDFATGTGFTSIGVGASLELDGALASVTIGAGTTNSGLAALAAIRGTLELQGNNNGGTGGVSLKTNVGLINYSLLEIDYNGYGDGASNVVIGGALANFGTIDIGNTGLNAATLVTASSLNNVGALNLTGNTGGSTTAQAELKITAAANTSATGNTRVAGNAVLDFGSGAGIKSIGTGATLELDGGLASVAIGSGAVNSGLASLAANSGTLVLQGNNTGAGGVAVTTNTDFTNSGTIGVDYNGYGDGGSVLKLGGALNNQGTLNIGNSGLSAATTVSASSLANMGTLYVQGNYGGVGASQAEVKINSAAAGAASGDIHLAGNALLYFASGTGITSINVGATLELDGAAASVAIGAGASNSGLASLASNSGTFVLQGDNTTTGGVILSTVAFTNFGGLGVDYNGYGDGGSAWTINGALTNNNAMNIGNNGLSASTAVMASSFINNGSMWIQGNSSASTALSQLKITGAAAATLTGSVRISGNALLDYASGSGITSIGNNATLELDGPFASVAIAAGATNSGLDSLASNNGALYLDGDTYGSGGVAVTTNTGFTNSGSLVIDNNGYGLGGSTFTIGGVLTNDGAINTGNGGQSATTAISAQGLNNLAGSITTNGNGSFESQIDIAGQAANYATVTINADSALSVTGAGNAYTQYSGTTNLYGTLTAISDTQYAGTTTIAGTLAGILNDDGGLVNFTSALTAGNGTGALNVGSGGVLEFSAASDSSHTVDFTDSTGTLELNAPASFASTISGFTDGDTIQLVGETVTNMSYASNVLDVYNGTSLLAALNFTGSYTTANFTSTADGHGNTDILLAHS
jgi:fibronectin-binding autotransporter adhesin